MLHIIQQQLILMATKEKTFYEQLGQRIAEHRKAQGITQTELATMLGIAQQTMAHYEGGVSRIAVAQLSALAHMLNTSIEELVGENPKRNGKRGPAPRIQQQLERLHQLPKIKQRAILQVLDSVLAQGGR